MTEIFGITVYSVEIFSCMFYYLTCKCSSINKYDALVIVVNIICCVCVSGMKVGNQK
jgi:hypothetical protein